MKYLRREREIYGGEERQGDRARYGGGGGLQRESLKSGKQILREVEKSEKEKKEGERF